MAANLSTLNLDDLAFNMQQEYSSVVYRNDGLFLGLFQAGGLRSGESFRFPIKVSGNGSATTYSEGAALGVAGNGTTVTAVVPWSYFRCIVNVTGHARDAARGNPAAEAAIADEFADATKALIALNATTFMADSAVGVLGLVDDTSTNLHGLSRTTYAGLVSHVEPGGSAALTLAMMQNTYEALRDNSRGAVPTLIIGPVNQVTNYINVAPQQAGGGTTPINVNVWNLDGSRAIDLGANWNAIKFNGIPFLGIPDMVDTEIVFLNTRPSAWEFVMNREITLEQYAKVDDSETFVVSNACALACKQPHIQGKIEALTA